MVCMNFFCNISKLLERRLCFILLQQLFDSLCAMLHDECLLLRTVELSHLNTCQSVKVSAKQILLFVEKFVPDFQKSKVFISFILLFWMVQALLHAFLMEISWQELLDNYLLGHDRVITSVEVPLQPNGITKQMEQLVYENFTLIRVFEERLCGFRKQDVDGGLVKEVLLGHLEAILGKVFTDFVSA